MKYIIIVIEEGSKKERTRPRPSSELRPPEDPATRRAKAAYGFSIFLTWIIGAILLLIVGIYCEFTR